MKVNNLNVKKCKTFYTRLMGLMFKKSFDYGLLFPKCNSIHTFFMKTNIDVIMTDIEGNVLYTFHNLKPYKIILPKKGVYYTFEFPVGKIDLNVKKIKIDKE
jgi:hypothetical protein